MLSHDAVSDACLTCGVCCFSTTDTYVRVTGDDHARLGDLAEVYTHFVGNRCYMRMTGEHCAALRVRDGRFECQVYAQRPDTCRDLARGSAACEGELSRKAHAPGRVYPLGSRPLAAGTEEERRQQSCDRDQQES